MNMLDIILKKRAGSSLTEAELKFFVKEYTAGNIPDYQASAFLMAVYFQGLDRSETFELTKAMRFSGDTMDLSSIAGIKVDKHSTGGVGDKTTLIVGPLAAACGVPIAKMSGRGLGFTGGTIDKLESIPGFRTNLAPEEFLAQVQSVGISVVGQSGHLTPADKKIYALRDASGTVENMSLIASSIMSKKLAAGADAIVLDVKCGRGAFMPDLESARTLSKIMVDIGEDAGRETVAIITDMNQPLGNAVGNSLEVREAIAVLSNEGPEDITHLSIEIAGAMIYLGGRVHAFEEGRLMAQQALSSGAGLRKLRDLITAQGGDDRVVDEPERLLLSATEKDCIAKQSGFVEALDAKGIGIASQHAGAGRETKEAAIDLGAGILLRKKVGDHVSEGEVLATVYASGRKKAELAAQEVLSSYTIGEERVKPEDLVKEIIRTDHVQR